MTDVLVPGAASAPQLRAHLALPPADAAGTGAGAPGVVVLHEAFGLTADVRRIADRFAAAGYVALAPDLYTSGGLSCVRSVFAALTRGSGPAVDDIAAARTWLAAREDCTGVVGVAGFCLGGGFALLLAGSGFAASSPAYGPLPRDLDGVLAGACPVVAHYGRRDLGLRGAAGKLEAALTRAGVAHDVREYPSVGHSFLNDHTLGVATPALRVLERVTGFHRDPEVEADAWRRTLAFFAEHLRGSGP